MTRNEAFTKARGNLNAFKVADFGHMMGRNKKPVPMFYSISGTVENPGNTVTMYGHTFHVDDLCPPTAKINAGF